MCAVRQEAAIASANRCEVRCGALPAITNMASSRNRTALISTFELFAVQSDTGVKHSLQRCIVAELCPLLALLLHERSDDQQLRVALLLTIL